MIISWAAVGLDLLTRAAEHCYFLIIFALLIWALQSMYVLLVARSILLYSIYILLLHVIIFGLLIWAL